MIYLQVREDFAVEHRVCYAQEILHGVIPIPAMHCYFQTKKCYVWHIWGTRP